MHLFYYFLPILRSVELRVDGFKAERLLCLIVKGYMGGPCLNLSPITVSPPPIPSLNDLNQPVHPKSAFCPCPNIQIFLFIFCTLKNEKKRGVKITWTSKLHTYRLLKKCKCYQWNLSGQTLFFLLGVKFMFYLGLDSSPGLKCYFVWMLIHCSTICV